MKKLVSSVLAASMVMSLAACGSTASTDTASSEAASEAASTAATTGQCCGGEQRVPQHGQCHGRTAQRLKKLQLHKQRKNRQVQQVDGKGAPPQTGQPAPAAEGSYKRRRGGNADQIKDDAVFRPVAARIAYIVEQLGTVVQDRLRAKDPDKVEAVTDCQTR